MNKRQALLNYAHSIAELKLVSNKYTGCCPVHQESNPSFWVYPDSGRAVCYSCGFSGDGVDLYRAINGGDYVGAKKALGLWEEKSPYSHKPRDYILDYKPELQWFLYESCKESVIFDRNLKIKIKGRDYQAIEYIYFCLMKMKSWRRGILEFYKEIHKKETKKKVLWFLHEKLGEKMTNRDRMKFFRMLVVNL